jgi:serine/threonine protein kinase
LLKEEEFLTKINPLGAVEGIQRPPYIKVINGMSISPLYAGDSCALMPYIDQLPIRRKLELCRQLLNGLNYLHNEGYVHGDIKPENCLVEIGEESDLPEKLVISDFGGVQEVRQNMKECPHTATYRPPDAAEQLICGYHRSDVLESCDVYAMCKTLIEILIGGEQGKEGMNNVLVDDEKLHSDLVAALQSRGVPVTIANILLEGLAPFEVRIESHRLYDTFYVALQAAGLRV